MRKKTVVIVVLLMLISCGKSISAEEGNKDLTVIVVPDFSFQEVKWLLSNSKEQWIWHSGGMAGLNVRPDGPYSYLNNIITLATGAKSIGIEGWNAFWKGEIEGEHTAEELYQQWTGKTVSTNTIFHPLFHKLVDKNNQTLHRSTVGILGELLKEHEVSTFVMGNSDTSAEKVRYGALLTMDQQGLSEGNLMDVIKEQPGFPFGVTTDVDKTVDLVKSIQNGTKKTFTVIEWGDIYRLYKQKSNMSSNYFLEQYEQLLRNLEQLVAKLHGQSDLILVSPMMHQEAYQNSERLAPLFYWQKDVGGNSFYLLSGTTRQEFVVSSLDFVPTVLAFYGIEKGTAFAGKGIEKKLVSSSPLEVGIDKLELMFLIFKTRNMILSSYITLLVLLLLVTSAIVMLKKQKDHWQRISKVLLVTGISSPLWLLLTPYLLNFLAPNLYLLCLILGSLLTGYLTIKYVNSPVFILNLLLFLAMTIDLLCESYFMQRSYLGYDPIIGARYYGIGNEYAGVYLISGMLLLEKLRSKGWLIIIAIVQFLMLSSTNLGANAGASISAAIMFAYFAYRSYLPDIKWRQLLLGFSGLLVLILTSLFLMQLFGEESHIGFAYKKLLEGDFQYIFDTIKRKLEMNWKIFRFSNWTQLFVTTYLLIALYLWRKKGIVGTPMREKLIQTGIVASIALLLLNDSGVVAAATSMFMIVCTSYYWVLEEADHKGRRDLKNSAADQLP